MKKNFIYSKLTMMMVATFTLSFTLASCGEEVIVQENTDAKKVTKFTAGDDGTRTSLDNERHFYWFQNDQIWVDTEGNGTFSTKSSYSQLSLDEKSADFYVTGEELTAASYNVLYTGNGSTTATSVTIPATRDYTAWNDKEAFGKSGDCGTATATRDSEGNYSFKLKHQASYLVISPILYITDSYYPSYVSKIEIISENNSTIAGTYPFSMSGLDLQNITNGSNKITINYTGNVYGMMAGQNDIYMPIVIAPGYHELTVKYKMGSKTFTYHLPAMEYKPNYAVNFNQIFAPDFYQWDAPIQEPMYTDGLNFNTTTEETAATQSCKDMPNANEMMWYGYNGDIRWDKTTPWAYGTKEKNYGGLWVKKKSVILADNTLPKCEHADHNGNGPTFCSEHAPVNFKDARTNIFYMIFSADGYAPNYHAGKPNDSVIDDYFFLPAMGSINSNGHPQAVGETGYYWSSTPVPTNASNIEKAHCFAFAQNNCAVGFYTYNHRSNRYVANPSMFK